MTIKAKKRKHNLQFTEEHTPMSPNSNDLIELKNMSIRSKYCSSRRTRKDVKRNTKNLKNTTRMLISIVCFFFFCQLPNLILNIYEAVRLDPEYGYFNSTKTEKILTFTTLSRFLIIINLSFNFLFYCCLNQRFKNIFKEKFNLTSTNSNEIELGVSTRNRSTKKTGVIELN